MALATAVRPGLAGEPAQPPSDDRPSLPETIPLFPLGDAMLFPNVSRAFHIFEPRYRAMVADALKGDRIIGMVMLQPGYEDEYEGTPPIFAVGCAGIISQVEMLPDGRYDIVLEGLIKFRVLDEDQSGAYRVADVEPLPELADEQEQAALRAGRGELLEALAARVPNARPPPPDLSDLDLVNGLAQVLDLDPLDRQDLLEAPGPLARARALIELVRRDPDRTGDGAP